MSSIATNINASRAENAMTNASQLVDKSTKELATGRRINTAADDTAGMAIGSKLTAESISLQRSMRNANEGVSMLQTADHAAGSMSQALVRMREIALQAANDTNSESDRSALDNEFTQLREHLNTAIDSTQWNGKKNVGWQHEQCELANWRFIWRRLLGGPGRLQKLVGIERCGHRQPQRCPVGPGRHRQQFGQH